MVKYPGGGVHIKSKGLNDVVVWNPREDAGPAIVDMEDKGWEKYVCVEPGIVTYWNDIAPSGKWRCLQTLETL